MSICARSLLTFPFTYLLILALAVGPVEGAVLPTNIDSRLATELKAQERAAQPLARALVVQAPNFEPGPLVLDSQGRVLVEIDLNGKATLSMVAGQILRASGVINGEVDWYRQGVISAYVPIDKIAALAASGTIRSILATSLPYANVGKVNSPALRVAGTDSINALGFTGKGITVGAISDSYDTATHDADGAVLRIHAAQDIASGDLPGPGNKFGHIHAVKVLQDGDATQSDEGRGMLQVVHDVAPDAALAFVIGGTGSAACAQNIIRLRTKAKADIIVDDLTFLDEPYYSDGIISQAVDMVSTTSPALLPGKKVIYFSSAGNQAGKSYEGIFKPITAKAATAKKVLGDLKLDEVPAELYSGGLQNFGTPTAPQVIMSFKMKNGTSTAVHLYWDDPQFVPNGITTDYNLLVFDQHGDYLDSISSTSDNFATYDPRESTSVSSDDDEGILQVVIARAGTSPTLPVARHLHMLVLGVFPTGNLFGYETPVSFGHAVAQNTIGVGAFAYNGGFAQTSVRNFVNPLQESYSSPGPAKIYFNAQGTRLPREIVRAKPDISALDGVETTFFGDLATTPGGSASDKYPKFFGTSCSAPFAAGVAALLLQKAGGPEEMTTDQMRAILINTANPLRFKSLIGISGTSKVDPQGNRVTVTAYGDTIVHPFFDSNFFRITYAGQAGTSLNSVTINLKPAGESFNTSATGRGFTLGSLTTLPVGAIRAVVPVGSASFPEATLQFTAGAFTPQDTVAFSIWTARGNVATYLEGATFTARTSAGIVTGTLQLEQVESPRFDPFAGYGLIDPLAALGKVKAP